MRNLFGAGRADGLGFTPAQATARQHIAHDELAQK
jgi:hypothetical protein